ncbi:hypothetical protein ACH33_11255 [Aneurinibacillus sp. XH2]|nr:hypothetical protein ACH33_11255 [Aneurinibacillus sp. XH2]
MIASEPQRLIINRFAAQAAAGYLNERFGERALSIHVRFFNAKNMYMRGERIQEGRECPDMGTLLLCFCKENVVLFGYCFGSPDCNSSVPMFGCRGKNCTKKYWRYQITNQDDSIHIFSFQPISHPMLLICPDAGQNKKRLPNLRG